MKKRLIAIAVTLALALCACAEITPSVSGESAASVSDESTAVGQKTVHILLSGTSIVSDGTERTFYGFCLSKIKTLAQKYTKTGLGNIAVDVVERSYFNNPIVHGGDTSYGDSIYDLLYDEYVNRTATGSEPDIVIFTSDDDTFTRDIRRSSQNTEYYKYIINDYLADLTPYMNDDDSYKPEDYVGEVMDGGTYEGEQLFIPLAYQLASYSGIEECSKVNGAPYPGSFATFDEFWSQTVDAAAYSALNGLSPFTYATTKSAYGSDSGRIPDYESAVCQQIYVDEPIINLTDYSLNRGDAAFRTMMRASFLSDNYFTEPIIDSLTEPDALYFVNSGKSCMAFDFRSMRPSDYFELSRGFFLPDSTVHSDITPYIRALPSYSDPEKHVASINLAMGVSASSDCKQEAYDFIRYCMEDAAFTSSICESFYGGSYPVKKSAIKSMIGDAVDSRLSQESYTADKQRTDEIYATGEQLYNEVTSISSAHPFYTPLNFIFRRRFKEVYDGTADHSDPDALIDEMCDLIDADLRAFFSD